MDASQKTHWSASLAFRLLLALTVIQVGFTAAELLGLTHFLDGFLEKEATSEAAQLGTVIRQATRQQMLGADGGGMQATMDDLGKVQSLVRVLIIDKRGRVAHATDRLLIGKTFDRNRDAECVVCHTATGVKPASTSIAVTEAAGPLIRRAEVIPNEPACARCHSSGAAINGVILVDRSTAAYLRARQTINTRVTLTGAAMLAALVAVTLFATAVLVVRPVHRLAAVVRRMGAGELSARAPVEGRGEIAHLSAAVNSMAEDLGRSIDEIRDKTAELSIVYSILGRVTKSISMPALKNVVIETFNEIMNADRTLLLSRTTEEPQVEVLSKARGADRIDRFLDDDSIGKAARVGAPAAALTDWLEGRTIEQHLTPDKRAAVLPIGDRVNAPYLLIVLRDQPFSEGEANPNLLSVVAGHVTGAFENSRLYQVATTDELTRLATARHLYSGIEAETSRREAGSREPCALLMIGLNHFGSVVERWGTDVGNVVLKRVAWHVMRLVRFGDSAFRYRRDVFAVLLPGCDRATAVAIADRICATVATSPIYTDTGEVVSAGLSVGGVSWTTPPTAPGNMVLAADQALTEAWLTESVRVAEFHAQD